MEYISRKNKRAEVQRQQDHWNDVHEQLIEVQKKSLAISDPQDSNEKEADAVARKVVGGESAEIHGSSGVINRSGEGSSQTTPEFQSKLEGSKGGGQSLDDSTKSEMGSKMGADLSGVKIHTGNEAHAMSENINAKAFTYGQDIYFNNGYSPANKELLAHELVHTVQQGIGINRKKIHRSVKFEIQTQNFVWAVNPSSPDGKAELLPRKYAPRTVGYEDAPAQEKGGNTITYLSLGKRREEAKRMDKTEFKEVHGDVTMVSSSENIPFDWVQAETVGQIGKAPKYNAALPAQFKVTFRVFKIGEYKDKGIEPVPSDVTEIGKVNRAAGDKALAFGTYNPFTYELEYVDGDNKDAVLVVYRNPQGMFVSGLGTLMIKKKKEGIADKWTDTDKPPEIIRRYRFKTDPPQDKIVGRKVGPLPDNAGELELFEEIDLALIYFGNVDYYNPNTFALLYYLQDKTTQLNVHLDAMGVFQLGVGSYMRVGRTVKPEHAGKEAQYIQVWSVKESANGNITYFDPVAKKELLVTCTEVKSQALNHGDKEKFPNMTEGTNYLADTYEMQYFFDTDIKNNVPVKEKMLDVHLEDGRLKSGHVKFMKEKPIKKDKEQTGLEIQSEEGGYLEFETSKWFTDWPDLNARVLDAVEFVDAANKQKGINDSKDTKNVNIMNAMRSHAAAKKYKRTGGVLGRVVKWPGAYSTTHLTNLKNDGRELYIEIVDSAWPSSIQFSEAIKLSGFTSLYAEHFGTVNSLEFYNKALTVVNAAIETYKKNNSDKAGISNSVFNDLTGFIQLLMTYIHGGQTQEMMERNTNKRLYSKAGFVIMARSNFASMFHEMLSPDEKAVYKIIVEDAANPIFQGVQPIVDRYRKAYLEARTEEKKTVPDQKELSSFPEYWNLNRWAPVKLDRTTLLFFDKVGKNQTRGPIIHDWLLKMMSTIEKKMVTVNENGVDVQKEMDVEVMGKDLLAGLDDDALSEMDQSLSDAMGARMVNTEEGNKDYKLAQFEVRASMYNDSAPGTQASSSTSRNVPYTSWVQYFKTGFDNAAKRAADTPDDPSTPFDPQKRSSNEASKTDLNK